MTTSTSDIIRHERELGTDACRRSMFDHGLLLLRVGLAVLVWTFHMGRKLADVPTELREFPDPLGIGHATSFLLALGSEGLCSILVALGLATRFASLSVAFTMAMVLVLAARGFEGADVQSALLYALPYTALVLTGAGRWLLDYVFGARYARAWARLTRRHERAR